MRLVKMYGYALRTHGKGEAKYMALFNDKSVRDDQESAEDAVTYQFTATLAFDDNAVIPPVDGPEMKLEMCDE